MASKWVLNRPDGPWDYPSLGFTANNGDILDAVSAPDAYWTLNGNQSAAETVKRHGSGVDSGYVEPTDGYILTYSDAANAYIARPPSVTFAADIATVTAAKNAAVAVGTTNDGVIASRIGDPVSATATALASGFVAKAFSGTYTAAAASSTVPASRAVAVVNDGSPGGAGEVVVGDGVTAVKDLPKPVTRNLNRARRQIAKAYPRAASRVPLPATFGWSESLIPGLAVLTDGTRYFTAYDAARRANTGGTTRYVNSVTGLNTNPGTSGSPYQQLSFAYTASADGDTIVIQDSGIVYRLNLASGTTMAKSINIVAANPGKVTLVCGDNLTYTATSGQPNVWQSARSNVLRVVDLKPDPLGFRYTKVADIASCNTLPGSWYNDGTTLYVHTLDGSAPTSDRIIALLGATIFQFALGSRTSDMNVYLEGFTVLGGTTGVTFTGDPNFGLDVTAKNCRFAHGDNATADGFQLVNCRSVVSQQVTVAHTGKDGFNYHSDTRTGSPTQFLEVDCEGHSCGLDRGTDYSQNGSTAHIGVKGVRIGGRYHYTNGAPLADVQTGCQTVNYSCDSWDSLAPVASGFNQGISAQQAGAEMWLYRCRVWGTPSDLYIPTGATMHVDDLTEYDTKTGAGTFDLVSNG